MNEKTHIDLFSGIGGFTLAAQANGIKTVAFCESDPRCRDFLAKAWPGIPCHGDIRTFSGKQYRGATWLLTGGVPCQPASRAGKQRGAGDDRWLWPEALRVLSEVRPAWVLFESPPGIEDVGLDGILADMEGKGYEVGPIFDIPACAVDAPHLRHRYWIVAHYNGAGREGSDVRATRQNGLCAERTEGDISNTYKSRRQGTKVLRQGRSCITKASQSNLSDPGGASVQQATAGRAGKARGVAAARTGQSDVPDAGEGKHGRRAQKPERGSQRRIAPGRAGEHLSDTDKGGRRRRAGKSGKGRRGKSADKSFWSDHIWASFSDGKIRRAPDDSLGMAHGIPVELLEALAEEEGITEEKVWREAERFSDARITGAEPHRSLLGALGNSIVWQVAAEIIAAMKETGA